MSECKEMEPYLNRRMSAAGKEAFELHLAACRQCKAFTAQWTAARSTLEKELDIRMPAIDESRARALVCRAEAPSSSGTNARRRPMLVGAFAAAAVFLVLLTTIAVIERKGTQPVVTYAPVSTEILYPKAASGLVHPDTLGMLTASSDDRLLARIGRARLGLDAGSRVRVAHADTQSIRLELIAGRIGVSLPPGKKRSSLSIKVNRIEISVKGTQFLVDKEASSSAISVSVREGVVQVSEVGSDTWYISTGKTFQRDAEGRWSVRPADDRAEKMLKQLLDPSAEAASRPAPLTEKNGVRGDSTDNGVQSAPVGRTPASSPDLDTIKQWVLKGDFRRSEQALAHRLTKTPRDMAALHLLAVCQRKSGRPKQAVKTYSRIIADGSPSERNRARFRAGVILQDQLGRHDEAITLFDDYLSDTGDMRANAAEARMRLAKSLKQKGDTVRYEQVLRSVVKEHGGTETAEQAARELKQLKRP